MTRLATLGFVIATAALCAAGQELSIVTQALPAAVYNQPYSPVGLATSGDAGPISWSFAPGSNIPQGFAVGGDSQTGTGGIFCYGLGDTSGPANCGTGVVIAPVGTYTIIIQATSASTSQSVSRSFSFSVVNPLQITTTTLPDAIANQAYSIQLGTIGGSNQFVWSILSGNLPPGIGLDPFKGVLSGTAPAQNGVYTFTVKLVDQSNGAIVTQPLTLNVVRGVNPVTVSITTTALPDAVQFQTYQFPLTGTGSNLVWSVSPATPLPPGFSLTPGGLLSGIPIVLGITVVQIQLVNAQVPTAIAQQQFTLRVTLGPLSINETTLPNAIQNVAYSTTLTPSGGIPPYQWSLDSSAPPGLSINAQTGVISGTLTTAKSYPVAVTLSDCAPVNFSNVPSCPQNTFTQNYILKVISPTVTITKTSLLPYTPGSPYVDTLTASGGAPPYTWSVSSGSLPAGLNLNSTTGQITGTAAAQGSLTFTIKATDSAGTTGTQVLTIAQGLTITTTSLPGAALGIPYSQSLAATGGTLPYTWTIASGTLPAGLQLNGSAITGTPTALGNFTFDVLATDAAAATARRTLTINVANPVVITSGDFTGTVLTAFSQTLAATGGTLRYTWSVTSGTLPAGLQLSSSGVISGTPTAAGASQVGFTATDANGLTGSKTIAITISQPPAPVTSITVGTTTQPAVSLATSTGYVSDITGVLKLAFSPSVVGATDGGEARFSDGSRSVQFTVRANQTQATFPTLTGTPSVLPGTVAGTITLTASMSAGGQDITPSPAPTKTIVIDPGVPVISSVALNQVSGGLNVVVKGYSNTREVSSGSFTFTVSSGNTLSQAQITVQLTSAFATWFGNSSSNASGGQFQLTVPFSATQGSAAAVTKVSVTLTNSKGASGAASSP